MSCDTRPMKGQTLTERKQEVKEAVEALDRQLLRKKVRPVIGPQGAITFQGWKDEDRGAVSDACAFRILMVKGSALAKAEIARAEQMAGRSVNRQAVAQGIHSHDGTTWHGKG